VVFVRFDLIFGFLLHTRKRTDQKWLRKLIHDFSGSLDPVIPEFSKRPIRTQTCAEGCLQLTSQKGVDKDIGRVVEKFGRVLDARRNRIGESSGEGLDLVAEEELGG